MKECTECGAVNFFLWREKTDVDPPLPDRVTGPELFRSSSEDLHTLPQADVNPGD